MAVDAIRAVTVGEVQEGGGEDENEKVSQPLLYVPHQCGDTLHDDTQRLPPTQGREGHFNMTSNRASA